MKRLIASVIVTVLAVSVTAEEMTLEQRRAKRDKKVMEKFGGYVVRPGTPAGSIVIVNAQKRVSAENFDITKTVVGRDLVGLYKIVEGQPVTAATAAEAKKGYKADFAVFVIDDKAQPPSLVAVEDQWAVMNIAPLDTGAVNDVLLANRAKKQFARVFSMVCGGFSSQFTAPLTNFIKTPADLDKCTAEIPVDVATRLLPYLEYHGVKPEKRVYYRNACQEGWAPQPTNKFQKAIWDQVHEVPKKPIKIEFDPKKGE